MDKSDVLIEETERIEKEASLETEAQGDYIPPGPGTINVESLHGKKKGNKTECRLCGKYYADIHSHLTGENACSRALKRLGLPVDGEAGIVEPAAAGQTQEFLPPGFAGSLLCSTFLNLCEQWLHPDFVGPSKRWQDQFSGSLQIIVDTHFGGSLDNPYFVLVGCVAELALANREGIKRKLKPGKNNADEDQGSEAGQPPVSIFGDSRQREDSNSQGSDQATH